MQALKLVMLRISGSEINICAQEYFNYAGDKNIAPEKKLLVFITKLRTLYVRVQTFNVMDHVLLRHTT